MKKLILIATVLISSQSLYAQSNLDLDMELDMDQTIDVSATYNAKKRLTPAQKMKLFRARLEKRNELMKAFDERDRAQRSHQRVQSDISTIQKEILDMRVKLRERALKLAGTTQPSTLLH